MVLCSALFFAACDRCRPEPTERRVSKISLWLPLSGSQLRGANIYQRRIYPELDGAALGPGAVGPPYNLDDFLGLARLGANTVIISHPGVFSEKPPFELDACVLANLDRLLELARQANLFAVIALRTGPGRSEFTFFHGAADTWFTSSYLDDTVWIDDSAQSAWARMWSYVAARYRNSKVVVGYELMVEPNSNHVCLGAYEPLGFLETHGRTSYDWNSLYPRLLAAVRAMDEQTPVLVDSMSYASLLWLPVLEPSGDPNVVHTVHQYAPVAYCHQSPQCVTCLYPGQCDLDGDGQEDPFNRQAVDELFDLMSDYAARHNAVLAVAELGVSRWAPGAADFLEAQLDSLENRGLSWAYWMFPAAWSRPGNPGEFDMARGVDPQSTSEDPSNPLLEVLTRYFALNERRPSNTSFTALRERPNDKTTQDRDER